MIAKTRTAKRMPEVNASNMQSISWLSIQHSTSEASKPTVEVYTVVGTVRVVETGVGVTGTE